MVSNSSPRHSLSDEERSIVNTIVGLPSDRWLLCDRVDDLVLLRGDNIHGMIIDLADRSIVCPPLPPVVRCTTDLLLADDDNLYLQDDDGVRIHTVSIKQARISVAKEGVIVTIWKDRANRVHFSTKRSIDADRTLESNTDGIPYMALWQILGGKDPKKLYEEDSPARPIYRFMISHPDLFHASKETGTGQLVYLGALSDDMKAVKRLKTVNRPINKQIYLPPAMSVDDANRFLQSGYHPSNVPPNFDSRLGTGEAIVVHCKDTIYHVKSRAYAYRLSLHSTGDTLEDSHRIIERCKEEDIYFMDNPPMGRLADLRSLIGKQLSEGRPYFTTEDFVILGRSIDRLRMGWLLFIATSPISQQRAAYESYLQFTKR